MKKVAVLVVAGMTLAGCSQYGAATQHERVHHGALIGGVAGGVIGATTGTVGGVVVGAGIGAVAGAAIAKHAVPHTHTY